MKKIVVRICEGSKYFNYENWLRIEEDVEIIKLSYKENNLSDALKCNGILLTGGMILIQDCITSRNFLAIATQKILMKKEMNSNGKLCRILGKDKNRC